MTNKPKNMKEKEIYRPTYDINTVDYYQEFRNTGEIIEVFQQYKKGEYLMSPPRYKEIDEILKLLRKTGIKKITIIR